jgi:hypothetical protein
MFIDNMHVCSVCGEVLASYGCCIYGDEKDLYKEDNCKECAKAVKDALEQKKYIESLNK